MMIRYLFLLFLPSLSGSEVCAVRHLSFEKCLSNAMHQRWDVWMDEAVFIFSCLSQRVTDLFRGLAMCEGTQPELQ